MDFTTLPPVSNDLHDVLLRCRLLESGMSQMRTWMLAIPALPQRATLLAPGQPTSPTPLLDATWTAAHELQLQRDFEHLKLGPGGDSMRCAWVLSYLQYQMDPLSFLDSYGIVVDEATPCFYECLSKLLAHPWLSLPGNGSALAELLHYALACRCGDGAVAASASASTRDPLREKMTDIELDKIIHINTHLAHNIFASVVFEPKAMPRPGLITEDLAAVLHSLRVHGYLSPEEYYDASRNVLANVAFPSADLPEMHRNCVISLERRRCRARLEETRAAALDASWSVHEDEWPDFDELQVDSDGWILA